MATIYFIADTHFSDETIIKYENRPFQSVSEMNSKIIHQWNTIVEKNDIVYILGDFGADKNEFSILNQLNGEKYLVKFIVMHIIVMLVLQKYTICLLYSMNFGYYPTSHYM